MDMDIQKDLYNIVYKKYIQPSERPATDKVGVEFEFPIVNLSGNATDFNVAYDLAEKFVNHFNFNEIKYDENGHIYFAENPITEDSLSFDCSYNTLELSFGPQENINNINTLFIKYYSYIQDELLKNNHTLTGMGVNPGYAQNRKEPIPVERYRMLFHHLSSYPKYQKNHSLYLHHTPYFGMFACASQVQLDICKNEIPDVLNTFAMLEPFNAVLFANSIWAERSEYILNRDFFWKNSTHGINQHNVDSYHVKFFSLDEVIKYIISMSMYCVMRDGKYINFKPTKLCEYFSSDEITGEYYENENKKYHDIKFKPEYSDIKYLRSFKFEDLTYRGTVEFRSSCEQPVSEIFAVSAYFSGLKANLGKLKNLLENDNIIYGKGYNATELRDIFSMRKFPCCVNKKALSNLLQQILDISEEGLKKRGKNEEHFIEPLRIRAEKLESPARQILREINEDGKDFIDIIKEFSKI